MGILAGAGHAKAGGCHAGLSGFGTDVTGSEPGKPSPTQGSRRLSPRTSALLPPSQPCSATPTLPQTPKSQPARDPASPSARPPPRGDLALRPRPSLGRHTVALGMRTGCRDSRCSASGHVATQSGFTQHNSFFKCPSFSLPSCNPGQIVHPQISVPCSRGLAG